MFIEHKMSPLRYTFFTNMYDLKILIFNINTRKLLILKYKELFTN